MRDSCLLAVESCLEARHAELGHGDADLGPAGSVRQVEAVLEIFTSFLVNNKAR